MNAEASKTDDVMIWKPRVRFRARPSDALQTKPIMYITEQMDDRWRPVLGNAPQDTAADTSEHRDRCFGKSALVKPRAADGNMKLATRACSAETAGVCMSAMAADVTP